jgi:hypothetical protein
LGSGECIYDNQERLKEFCLGNLVLDSNITDAVEYFTVDSFNAKNQPLVINYYQITKNEKTVDGSNEFTYDSLDRIQLKTRNSVSRFSDSSLSFYTKIINILILLLNTLLILRNQFFENHLFIFFSW